MLYGLYLSASGMALSQHQQDVVANNLANVDTVGFKRDLSVFQERLQAAQIGGMNRRFLPSELRNATGGAFVASVQTDFSQGGIDHTGNNLDLAIEGRGFLMIRNGEEIQLTRDGRLALVEDRLVRQIDGKPVLDEHEREIVLPHVDGRSIQIDRHGNLSAGDQQFAKIAVVDVEELQQLIKTGGNLYDPAGQSISLVDTPLLSGAVETSTVDPAMEMVEMIKIARTFQMNAELISLQDQSLGRLINELPKL